MATLTDLTSRRISRLASDPRVIEIGERFHDIVEEIGAIHGNNFDAQMASALLLALQRSRHAGDLADILERSKHDESQTVQS